MEPKISKSSLVLIGFLHLCVWRSKFCAAGIPKICAVNFVQ